MRYIVRINNITSQYYALHQNTISEYAKNSILHIVKHKRLFL